MIETPSRTILHVDLDAFYASVEQRDDPELRGKPVVVGARSKRGVVAAASYEARTFGIRSAMPMAEAMRRCQKLEIVSPRMSAYAEASENFFGILGTYSPLVEGLSLDEAFLDATGAERLLGNGLEIATQIKSHVVRDLGLVASVGIACNKFLAKIASDLQKPDGLVLVPRGKETEFLEPLPIRRLWGVGKATQRELDTLSVRTIGDLRAIPLQTLARRVGPKTAQHLWNLSFGQDHRRVSAGRKAVSIGHEDTFGQDVFSRDELARRLLGQGDRVCARLRKKKLLANVICIKVKYANHQSVTRRCTLPDWTSDGSVVGETTRELLKNVDDIEKRGVRLTGVHVSGLRSTNAPTQLSFEQPEVDRAQELGKTIDQIAEKFGSAAVKRGSLIK